MSFHTYATKVANLGSLRGTLEQQSEQAAALRAQITSLEAEANDVPALQDQLEKRHKVRPLH